MELSCPSMAGASPSDPPDAISGQVSLSALLERGPVALVFYRGEWRPYCNLTLRAYQTIQPQIQELGATMVAVSPQTPDNSLTTVEKKGLTFPVLSDQGNAVAREYGLVWAFSDGLLLVVQADGKGVPLVQPPAGVRLPRLGKGQKRTKKKEAVVTSLYTIAPYVRSPRDVVAALLCDDDDDRPPLAPRPQPQGKELRATLDGKEVALTRLAGRARQREGTQIHDRVALTDGAEALQRQIEAYVPQHTLVLDIIHATDYLWDAATALLGEAHPDRTAWVRTHLEALLTARRTRSSPQPHWKPQRRSQRARPRSAKSS